MRELAVPHIVSDVRTGHHLVRDNRTTTIVVQSTVTRRVEYRTNIGARRGAKCLELDANELTGGGSVDMQRARCWWREVPRGRLRGPPHCVGRFPNQGKIVVPFRNCRWSSGPNLHGDRGKVVD